jgi:hypothetical protein
VGIEVEMQRSYLDYAMSVIVGRALPRCGTGSSRCTGACCTRCTTAATARTAATSSAPASSATSWATTTRTATAPIYDTLVRLAQPWSLRYPLVDGNGNFGSPGNDPAAAMRYTECRLAPLAMEMLREIDQETVDFTPNYDGRSQEPTILPSRIPNLLVNGSSGIAVGMATNIPPHNLREVGAGVQWALRPPGRLAEELLDALLARVQGPDFPTGGLIVGRSGIEEAYRTGRGSVRMRAVVEVDEDAKGRTILVVSELPVPGQPDNLAESIADLVRDGKIGGIADVRDEGSQRLGQRLVIVLKRDAVAKVVLNNLYKHTQLQYTFGCNMLAIVDGVPARCASTSSSATTSPTRSTSSCGAPASSCAGRGAGAHPARARQGARPHGRRHRAHPRVGERRGRAQRAHGAARHRRGAGRRDPRHAAAPARRARAPAHHGRAREREREIAELQAILADPAASGASSARSSARSSSATATSAAPGSWRTRAT